ncbi:MAG: hypothetical protein U1E62_04425 [Alsobacter sp.]
MTLKGTPANLFAFDAAHFVPRPGGIPPAVDPPQTFNMEGVGDYLRTQRPGQDWILPDQNGPDDGPAVASPSDESDAGSAGPQDEINLYAAGASAFRRKHWDTAARKFEMVLALPADDRRTRGLDAAYSLGRARFSQHDFDAAEAAFARVREMAVAGIPDPEGLASASLGESARIHLERARASAADGAPDVAAAVRLYAEQASTGSRGAPLSLRIVVQNWILDQPGMLERIIADPVVQRVVVSYALTRTLDDVEPGHDAGLRRAGGDPNPTLVRVVEAAAKAGVSEIAGSGRLAAAAYRAGRYDVAERVASQAATPLGEWVLAKIAIQNGAMTSALKHYAAATRLLRSAPDDVEPWMQARLSGEFAKAALSKGQIAEAFDMLNRHPMEFWVDAAYVADRLLGLDELKRYVDHKVPALPEGTRRGARDDNNRQEWQPLKPPATALRNLLARRLVRAGRIQEAIPYFDRLEVRDRAAAYDRAIRKAAKATSRMERAEAWYAAGMLARRSGMEMMGTEDAPDFFFYDGNFVEDEAPNGRPGPYVSGVERALAKRSAPRPERRYHYRFIAYDHMMRAVDQLPPGSQSAAAILCRAGEWMRKTPNGEKYFKQAWRRYQNSGASYPFARTFGFRCPEPEAFAQDPLFAPPPKEDLEGPI